MPSSTVENYLKQLYVEERDHPGKRVSTGRLAEVMGVTPGTATSMAKSLAQSGWVDYAPRLGARLTPEGRALSLRVLRRHRLIELFLVRCLRLDWSQVHEEAEALEHVISDRVLDRIDDFLGHPSTDPHGAPIPSAEGIVTQGNHTPLSSCMTGDTARVCRVAGHDPDFLVFLDKHGLRPGCCISVVEVLQSADAIRIRVHDAAEPLTLGLGAAARIHVETL